MNPLYDTLFGRHSGSNAPFLHLPSGETVTYGSFVERVSQMGGALRGMGLNPGDRLAAQVEKSPDAVALFGACAAQGIVLLPLNTAYTPTELAYFVTDSGARMLLTDPEKADALADVARKAGARLETLGTNGDGTLAEATDAAEPAAPEPRNAQDLAAFLYTSGTTGRSKGAMLSQENLISNARVLTDYWRFSDSDTLIHALPIFHTHGLFVALNVTLLAGGSMIFLPRFDVDAVLEALPRATTMMGVPTFYTRLLADDRFTRDVGGHLRLYTSGSAPMLEETHHRFEQRIGQRILERYGMTETSMSTSNPYERERRPGTVGFPLPGVELRICIPGTEDEVPTGETGMIEVRGPNVFQGYWQMPEKTAEELRSNGWFITGDLGVRDADGYVTIVGRDKDLVISGGYNIYPREIEQVIDAQPGVLESAVIGVPHPDMGEGLVAVIVPRPGETPDDTAIAATVSAELARFKQPRQYVTVPQLPRNTMGKVQKAELRRVYADTFVGHIIS
ncbi:malonate--CoA ligase [Pontibaca salina]|uniref:Malonyl-CoA synthase n=1 Tax=Pontibaca salina TaxID=2795731 RepID=A0A934HQC7_9RHOB|nr:malonyl-CoA synthase [Pontibaca salina]MBI6629557.1 malonyl-CoA synthase [Pontibaca salina]